MDDNTTDGQATDVVDEAVEAAGDGSAPEVETSGPPVPDETWKVAQIDEWAEGLGLELPSTKKADKLAYIEGYLEVNPPEVIPAEPAPPSVNDLARILNAGDRGPEVERLQEALGLPVSGHYDRWTQNAVRRFQAKVGSPITGRVDSVTWQALGL